MTENADTTELIDRAEVKDGRAIVAYSYTEAALAALRAKYSGATYNLTTTAGDRAARAARLELVTLRGNLEKKRKELKAPALDFGKKIDSEAARLTAEIQALEAPIDAQIKADEKRREDERRAKEEAEAARKKVHTDAIAKIAGYVALAAELPSERIAAGITFLEGMELAGFEEYTEEATATRERTIAALRALQLKAKAREDEEARLKAEREEQARVAAEQAETARKLKAQQEEMDRQREAIEAEERRLEAERARIRAEEQERAAEAARHKNEMALQEIQGIQQQVYIATLGRAGVRKGGTIECIRETLAETEAWVIDERFGVLQGSAQAAKDKAISAIRQQLADAEARAQAPAPTPAPTAVPAANVLPMPTKAPAPATSAPTLRLGVINERIAPLSITEVGLASLGFPHAATEKAAKLYHEADFPRMCLALVQHLQSAARQQEAA
jgi:hypothetical protein